LFSEVVPDQWAAAEERSQKPSHWFARWSAVRAVFSDRILERIDSSYAEGAWRKKQEAGVILPPAPIAFP
jgi:hypothetical protein